MSDEVKYSDVVESLERMVKAGLAKVVEVDAWGQYVYALTDEGVRLVELVAENPDEGLKRFKQMLVVKGVKDE